MEKSDLCLTVLSQLPATPNTGHSLKDLHHDEEDIPGGDTLGDLDAEDDQCEGSGTGSSDALCHGHGSCD